MQTRAATAADRDAIIALHVSSMQRTYGSFLPERYLQETVPQERRKIWTERFDPASSANYVIRVATQHHALIGFACIKLLPLDQWGNLVDNLHVDPNWQGHGLGRRLLAEAIAALPAADAARPLQLVVYEQNHGARKLYDSLEGEVVERVEREPEPGRTAFMLRYRWPDAGALGGRLG